MKSMFDQNSQKNVSYESISYENSFNFFIADTRENFIHEHKFWSLK